ncbi:hypothetical protein RB199_00695 [Streptomyces libani]
MEHADQPHPVQDQDGHDAQQPDEQQTGVRVMGLQLTPQPSEQRPPPGGRARPPRRLHQPVLLRADGHRTVPVVPHGQRIGVDAQTGERRRQEIGGRDRHTVAQQQPQLLRHGAVEDGDDDPDVVADMAYGEGVAQRGQIVAHQDGDTGRPGGERPAEVLVVRRREMVDRVSALPQGGTDPARQRRRADHHHPGIPARRGCRIHPVLIGFVHRLRRVRLRRFTAPFTCHSVPRPAAVVHPWSCG